MRVPLFDNDMYDTKYLILYVSNDAMA